ncbi:MAG TPA: hypothetical protein VHZ24_09740 [Pirellulales bacterium]|nr:hypothetical protein [Pirellulales bacterium]
MKRDFAEEAAVSAFVRSDTFAHLRKPAKSAKKLESSPPCGALYCRHPINQWLGGEVVSDAEEFAPIVDALVGKNVRAKPGG